MDASAAPRFSVVVPAHNEELLVQIRAALRGTDTAWVDRYFFDFNPDRR